MLDNILIIGENSFISKSFKNQYIGNVEMSFLNRKNYLFEFPELSKKFTNIIILLSKQKDTDGIGFQDNYDMADFISSYLDKKHNVFFSSSIHVETQPDSNFSVSKLYIENKIINSGCTYYIERLTHQIGFFQKPFHNSFISTLAYSIKNNLEYSINSDNELYLYDIVCTCDEIFKFFLNPKNKLSSQYERGHKISLNRIEALLSSNVKAMNEIESRIIKYYK